MTSDELSKSIKILNSASTDEEKLASLLIVAKTLKAERFDAATRKNLFTAVGFKFLSRLLKSENATEGCSRWSYRSLAVTILLCICSDNELVVHPEMLANLKQFNEIITALPENSENEEEQRVVTETYECLSCFASQPPSLEALIQHCTVNALCRAVAHRCYGWQKAQQLMMYIVNMNGSDTWKKDNTQGLQQLLSYFTQQFKQEQDERKFGVCSTIYIILSTVEKDQMKLLDGTQWCGDLQETIYSVLKNKLGSPQREPVLKLASMLVDLLGVDWTIGGQDADRKFLLLLVHLCCIEIRMALESGDFQQVENSGELLCSCYLLLENVISYMTTCPSLQLDDKQVRQLHSAMTGAFNAVIHFLNTVQEMAQQRQESNITVASVRVLGSWIAEETSALQDKVIQILPFLLLLGKKGFEQTKSKQNPWSNTKSPQSTEDMDTDAEPMEDVLQFLLPGFCHLSSEDNARKVIIQERGHELLAQYLSYRYILFSSEGKEKNESRTVLTTLCGVFLNLVVMETELVSTDPVFSELLNFLITTLPGIVETDLVIAFNMCVMCLMLMRHHANKLQVSSSDCDKMFTSAIKLFWVHDHTEGQGQCHLIIKEKFHDVWSEVSELWFLGMQAFNACIPLFSQISTSVLRSGWIPSFMKTLIKINGMELDDMTRESYSGLLLQLALNREEAKNVIKEKEGSRLAQMYGFGGLADCLSR